MSCLTRADAQRLEECVRAGGVAVFPADTVYGICCDPCDERAVARVYELKGRPASRAAAVMFFTRDAALAELAELAPAERRAAEALLPGAVTLLLGNPRRRFAPACAGDPDTLGLRVPAWPRALAALEHVGAPVMQTSANLSGGADARELAQVPEPIRTGADLVLDAGAVPGISSTVVDLRGLARGEPWRIVRAGALGEQELAAALTGVQAPSPEP